jgi:Flp pilus assembly protein TadD
VSVVAEQAVSIESAWENLIAGKIDEAESACEEILRGVPEQSRALHLLGTIQFGKGRATEAADFFARAVKSDPGFADAYSDLGAVLIMLGRSAEAARYLKTSVELSPNHSEAHTNLGNALHSLGQIEAAEHHYLNAVETDAGNVRAIVSLGNVLCQMRRTEEAIECLTRASALSPEAADIHAFLGTAQQDAGKTELAEKSYRKALSLQPNLSSANESLGTMLMANGEYEEARRLLVNADTPISRSNALECLLRLRRYDDFFSSLEGRGEADGDNLYLASLSAYASQQLGRSDPHPFCPNPLDYVRVYDALADLDYKDQFIADLLAQVRSIEALWEPRSVSTKKGFQTGGNLFAEPTGALAKLDRLVKAHMKEYRNSLSEDPAILVRKWPRDLRLQGWYVRLVKGGHQTFHNHPFGWLSGVIYLDVPKSGEPDEGAIEFSLKNNEFPEISGESPTRQHKPAPGQLALFPSSLFHRTIPFASDEERLCIAFDLLPDPTT